MIIWVEEDPAVRFNEIMATKQEQYYRPNAVQKICALKVCFGESRANRTIASYRGTRKIGRGVRNFIRSEVSSVLPFDSKEMEIKKEVLEWIDSGVELCRIEKPAIPPKHLVSYFVVVDFPFLLLVDHINAQLWLPTGGHVEPGEHPKDTVIREAREELNIHSEFLYESPVLLTMTETVGLTAGHTDVSLWYVLKGSKQNQYKYDPSEFNNIQWFHIDELPYENTDPEMFRFVQKFSGICT